MIGMVSRRRETPETCRTGPSRKHSPLPPFQRSIHCSSRYDVGLRSRCNLSLCVSQVFQTFVASFNEQRRPIMPLLIAMRRSSAPSDEQRGLREAWDALTEKVGYYLCYFRSVGLIPSPTA